MRIRLKALGCPRRTLSLIDTARPDCPNCRGTGGIAHDYGHPETGEYEGTRWEPCLCCPCRAGCAAPRAAATAANRPSSRAKVGSATLGCRVRTSISGCTTAVRPG